MKMRLESGVAPSSPASSSDRLSRMKPNPCEIMVHVSSDQTITANQIQDATFWALKNLVLPYRLSPFPGGPVLGAVGG